MKIFLTGGTGFLCGRVARLLRERGDEVVALVRTPAKGRALEEAGCELVAGDLADREALRTGMRGCDAVVHGAAIYSIGITAESCRQMRATNVDGTVAVMDAALDTGVPRVVYISSIVAHGNTRGAVADEDFGHPDRHRSCYNETKHRAHEEVLRLTAERGLPVVTVQPGGIYGPNDHSEIGEVLRRFYRGRLPAMLLPETAVNLVYLDDVADGIVLALDRGVPGESYILGGENTTVGEAIRTAARLMGRRPPRFSIPTPVLKAMAPVSGVLGPPLGLPPNLAEVIDHSSGPTWWATSAKAERELGYSHRSLEEGMHDLLVAEGVLPPVPA